MIGFIAVGVVLLSLIFYSLYLLEDVSSDFGTGLIFGLLIVILTVAEILIVLDISNTKKSEPQAIDVYRGNTELEIHSINNIPQDTVVVWKGGKQ